MPREDRRIIFTFDEVFKALYALCMQREIACPQPGVISAIEIDNETENKLIVTISNFQDASERKTPYSRDFMAAALMLYCRTLRIPISRQARKSVELKDDGVILRLVI